MKSPNQPYTESEEGQGGPKLAYTQDKREVSKVLTLLSKVTVEWEIRKSTSPCLCRP